MNRTTANSNAKKVPLTAAKKALAAKKAAAAKKPAAKTPKTSAAAKVAGGTGNLVTGATIPSGAADVKSTLPANTKGFLLAIDSGKKAYGIPSGKKETPFWVRIEEPKMRAKYENVSTFLKPAGKDGDKLFYSLSAAGLAVIKAA